MPSFDSPFCADVLWFNLYLEKKQKTYFDIICTYFSSSNDDEYAIVT
jgi:hypothetical protein